MSVDLTATAATPTSVGWYNPEIVDRRFYIRPSSLKGVWRWWTRALIAGVLYDANLLECGKSGTCTFRGTEMNNLLGCLGLGSGGDKGSGSKYQILVSVEEEPLICLSTGMSRLQRARLLSMKNRQVEFFIGGRFRIKMRRLLPRGRPAGCHVEELSIDLVKKLFILSLSLGGIGKGSRRGFGSIDILSSGDRGAMDLKQLITNVRNELFKHFGVRGEGERGVLPPVTLISASNTEIYEVSCKGDWGDEILDCKSNPNVKRRLRKTFVTLHNFFVRTSRERMLGSDELRRTLSAWVLGLPRHQRNLRRGIETGYFAESDRRASPFIVSYHEKHIVGGSYPRAYVTVIKSADWPRNMKWKMNNATDQPLRISDQDIINATERALRALKSYLERQGCTMTKVWP